MSTQTNANATAVATINKQNILVFEENATKYVAVKPICEALGVNLSGQIQRLKRDEILSSVVCTIHTTGSDKKQYEMVSLPLKYVFGWLFTIDNSKVKNKDGLIKYQKQCYDTLYREFYEKAEFYHQKEQLKLKCALKIARVKNEVTEAKKELQVIEELDFNTWQSEKRQLQINFDKKGGQL